MANFGIHRGPDEKEEPMSEQKGVSRRDLFQIVAGVPALAAATAGAAAAQTHPPAPHPAAHKVFDKSNWPTLCAVCDLIIPADDRSGSATQAGVPEYIDDWLDFRRTEDGNADLMAQILGGLAWLDHESQKLSGEKFAQAGAAKQKQILDRIAWPEKAAEEDKRWAAFFSRMRDLTLNGFYSSKMGIA